VRQGAPGAVHAYTVDLHVDTFFEISVSQETKGVRLAVSGPDGDGVTAIDLPSIEPLPERAMFVASRAGTYRIDVFLPARVAPKRPVDEPVQEYVLRVLALQPAGERDRHRARCFATTADASRLANRRGLRVDDLGAVLDLLNEAAACWQSASDVDLEATALEALAGLSSLFTEYRLESAAAFERLIAIRRATGEARLELLSLDNLTVEYNDDGRFDRARDTAAEMQRLAGRLGDRRSEGRAWRRIAFAEFSLGHFDSARRAALAALDIAKEVGDESLLALAHWQLGRIDEVTGDFEAALARYDQGLQAAPGDWLAAPSLANALGFLHLRMGDHDAAARYFEKRLALASGFVQRDTEAQARVGLGDVLLARGDREGARTMYHAAAEMLTNGIPSIRCIAIQRLGRRALEEGRLEEAAAHFGEMLAIDRQIANPPCEAEAQAGIADVAFRRGDLAAAETAAREVIRVVEQFREATPSLESRALGFGALKPAFERAVEVVMARAARADGQAAARALALHERALARGLLDHLAEAARDDARAASHTLAVRARRLREQWRVRVAQYQIAARTPRDRPRAERLRQEMTALDLQIRDLEARDDAADAGRARMIRPDALDAAGVQALLDDDTTLLEYALGEQQSYLWVVTSRDVRAVALAPRAAIESAARAMYRDLTTAAGSAGADAEERRRTVSQLVLAPAASMLAGRRLVIVSTGALSLVPFAALPFERAPGDRSTLISWFEIVHVPSATTLAAMRALAGRRPPAQRHTVVFADPIFEIDDPRVAGPSAGAAGATPDTAARSRGEDPPAGDLAASVVTRLGASFPRLPFSRDEARALGALAPGRVTTLLDGLATRDRALGDALREYRFIHFATHAIVHPELPGLSSIVLSFVDGSGARRDPFLTLSDVSAMRLGADLVVLSACSTADGRYVPGEGPIGLARGFMYAGVPRVAASLWRVNDIATAELMKRFYRGMLVEGRTAAAALRTAQQEVAAIPRWASPYYWAPFVLQGDWR
jgi:CHAT domain-containing protein/predicted negative regulator of RcsB-dependent stress response